uniref:Dirigent protein n=1 Tax=Oryza punctata TaxID=4537 RepID=A0A0E0LG53_ORYPU
MARSRSCTAKPKLHQWWEWEWPLLAAVITVILAAAFAVPASAARRRPVRLHLYMHDIAGETAVQVVKGTGPLHPSMPPGNRHFGDTTVMDDLLTEGPSVDSKPVGRAQGSYVLAGLVDPVVVVTATLKLTDGPYSGSTIVIAGRDDVLAEVRELAVVGGTGKLRRASGHVLWRTAEVLAAVHYVLELDLRMERKINTMAIISIAAHLLALILAVAVPASAGGLPVRLRLYMHDITGGPGQTAVQVVNGTGPLHPAMPPGSHFGDTMVVDDLLTDDDSKAVGRAQGSYTLACLRAPVLVVSVTLVLTDGPYKGSTILIAGRDDISKEVRELAVIGGTGKLRRATGHVLWTTARLESPVHMVLELDVYAWVPAPSAPARRWSSLLRGTNVVTAAVVDSYY